MIVNQLSDPKSRTQNDQNISKRPGTNTAVEVNYRTVRVSTTLHCFKVIPEALGQRQFPVE